jgi:hypothetical protein
MSKPIVVVDFDGVIHEYKTPWVNAWTIPDLPVKGVLLALAEYVKDGMQIAVVSSRSSSIRGRWAMRSWFWRWAKNQNLAEELRGSVTFPRHKPPAILSIDDRAHRFDGANMPSPEAVRGFVPWNKVDHEELPAYLDLIPEAARLAAIRAASFLAQRLGGNHEEIASWCDGCDFNSKAPKGWHFAGGRNVRNALRKQGFDEFALKVDNLDDVYCGLILFAWRRKHAAGGAP